MLSALAVLPCVTGCRATIGPAPARLSAELGDRLAEMQGLHQLAIERYFETERARIDDFIRRTWIPLFLRNFLGASGLLTDIEDLGTVGQSDRDAMAEAVATYLADPGEAGELRDSLVNRITAARSREGDDVRVLIDRYVPDDQVETATAHVHSLLRTPDRGALIIEWAEDAQTVIAEQRTMMMAPLLDAEQETRAELAAAYAEMLKANGVLTARLEAAARRQEAEDRLLESLGVRSLADSVQARMTSISGAVGTALQTATEMVEAATGGSDAAARVLESSLREGLNRDGAAANPNE